MIFLVFYHFLHFYLIDRIIISVTSWKITPTPIVSGNQIWRTKVAQFDSRSNLFPCRPSNFQLLARISSQTIWIIVSNEYHVLFVCVFLTQVYLQQQLGSVQLQCNVVSLLSFSVENHSVAFWRLKPQSNHILDDLHLLHLETMNEKANLIKIQLFLNSYGVQRKEKPLLPKFLVICSEINELNCEFPIIFLCTAYFCILWLFF